MSTPRREEVERKVRAGAAMDRYATWLENAEEELAAIGGLMPAGENFAHGQIEGVRRMLSALREDARYQADLWQRVGRAEARSRLTDAELAAVDAAVEGEIEDHQRRRFEDTYLDDPAGLWYGDLSDRVVFFEKMAARLPDETPPEREWAEDDEVIA